MGERIRNHWTHMTHCNAGEQIGHCKYGDDHECPALKGDSPQSEVATKLKAIWKEKVAADQTTEGFWFWVTEAVEAVRLWSKMYEKIHEEIDAEEGKRK